MAAHPAPIPANPCWIPASNKTDHSSIVFNLWFLFNLFLFSDDPLHDDDDLGLHPQNTKPPTK